jgi:hypothetical protein
VRALPFNINDREFAEAAAADLESLIDDSNPTDGGR